MLCLSVWLGALPTRHVQKLKVYSKLGGNVLGLVDKHCMQNQASLLITYDTLRRLQDQVALIFKHEFLASKYIVIYVGAERLTKPNFPFVAQPDFEEQAQVVAVLQNAQSIAVMFDSAMSDFTNSVLVSFGPHTARSLTTLWQNDILFTRLCVTSNSTIELFNSYHNYPRVGMLGLIRTCNRMSTLVVSESAQRRPNCKETVITRLDDARKVLAITPHQACAANRNIETLQIFVWCEAIFQHNVAYSHLFSLVSTPLCKQSVVVF